MEFEWSEDKNKSNQKKNGVSFYNAQYVFADSNRIVAKDLKHSQHEKRYYCFGKAHEEILTVRFTYRGHKKRNEI